MLASCLDPSFYKQGTIKVAEALLGKCLVRKISPKSFLVGRIVETEAYIGKEDKACHASWRKREGCKHLWGPAGHLYVYLTYGMYFMCNVVTEKDGFPAAVLIRAIEPILCHPEFDSESRSINMDPDFYQDDKEIINKLRVLGAGPGKLTRWMKIDKSFDGEDLVKSGRIGIKDRGEEIQSLEIVSAPRIGVDYAGEWKNKPWRFYVSNSPFVSRKQSNSCSFSLVTLLYNNVTS